MALTPDQYHDYGNVIEETLEEITSESLPTSCSKQIRRGPRGGVTTPFPVKLYQLLEEQRFPNIISWQPHGRCFLLRKQQEFLNEVMPKYFKQTKLTSFQRQLNLYAFRRISSGPDKGAYYHELFLKGKPTLCNHIFRMRVKGTKTKSAVCSENEPNFYQMPPLQDCSVQDTTLISEDDTVSSRSDQSTHQDTKIVTCNSSTTETMTSDQYDNSDSVSYMSYQDQRPGPGMGKNLFYARQSPPKEITQVSSHSKSCAYATSYTHLSSTKPRAVSFEGKEFYYLDPLDHWDACTLPLDESQSTPDLIGLSVIDGEVCGFE